MGTSAAVPPSDAQLVAASRFDGGHFVTVFDRHVGDVHAYLARRLGEEGSAHLGDAFTAAYATRRRFRAWGESARPWLLGVATGVVRRQWRLEQQVLRSCAALAPGSGSAEVADHLQHLAARDRDIVVLATWEDQPPAAIAMALDLPDGAVAARLTGLATELAGLPGAPGGAPADGMARVRALRPEAQAPDPFQVELVRGELQVLTGQTARDGVGRSTDSVAAEHEQHRRWLARPGASLTDRTRR